MEKQTFRTALRIWFRLVFWIGRLILSPFALIIFLIFGLFDGVSFLYHWTNENHSDIDYHREELNGHWKALKKWMSY
jgi:hypothetical protein